MNFSRRALLLGTSSVALCALAEPTSVAAQRISDSAVGRSASPQVIVDLTTSLSSAQTTGSISAASNQLTVANATNFAIGQTLIVEIGGEVGAGARGTSGVGGVWPALFYANTTLLNADHSQPDNTFAWVTSSGDVYQWSALSTVWTQVTAADYYTAKASPLSLIAKITAKSGNVLTLDTTASTAATAAAVYIDNSIPINTIFSALADNTLCQFPTGTYAFSSPLIIPSKSTITLQGTNTTTLLSPKGLCSISIEAQFSPQFIVNTLTMAGNAMLSGYGWDKRYLSQTVAPVHNAINLGVILTACHNHTIHHVILTDAWYSGTRYCNYGYWHHCTANLTQGQGSYIQWQFDYGNSFFIIAEDMYASSPVLSKGFEFFQCGQCIFRRITGINMVAAMNSSGAWLVDDFNLTITANSQLSAASFSSQEPCLSINSNISPTDPLLLLGGRAKNVVINQQGYINASNDSLRGIVINIYNPNISVEGGSYIAPNYASPSVYDGPIGINSTGNYTLVDGFTQSGIPRSYSPNPGHAFAVAATGVGSIVKNTTAYNINATIDGGGNHTIE